MKMTILARGIALTTAIQEYAQRRLGSALGRYRDTLGSVHMRLIDVNGPRGGIDKHCTIEVRGPALQPIIVRERYSDLYAAIDRAADRLDRTVARRLARGRTLSLRAPRS